MLLLSSRPKFDFILRCPELDASQEPAAESVRFVQAQEHSDKKPPSVAPHFRGPYF